MFGKRSQYSLPPLGSSPWLVLSHGRHKQIQTFFNPVDGSTHHRSIPEMRRKRCLGCSNGWLMMIDDTASSKDCFLLSLASMESIPLPPLPIKLNDDRQFILSAPADAVDCSVVLFDRRQALFHRLHADNGKGWTVLDVKEARGLNVIFSDGITTFEGKICLHTNLNSLVTIDMKSSNGPNVERVEVERIFKTKRDPCRGTIVVSRGELLAVILYFERPGGLVTNAEVYRLDCSSLVWERLESIGDDRAIFLGHCGGGLMVSDERVRGDCIYFMQASYDGMRWYRFRLDERSISHKLFCPGLWKTWQASFLAILA